MGKIARFEEIESWKRARVMTREVNRLTASGGFGRDFGLRDQLRRASVSILSNIAEGFERGGNKEFIQFLSNAKGSAGELRAQLYVALDAGLIDQRSFETLYSAAEETSRLIGGLMRYLRQSDCPGEKFSRGDLES